MGMSVVAEQLPPGPRRPGWSLTGAEILAELDALHEAQTRLAARRLELLGRLDELGHARELGARDTVELLSLRHRLDPHTVRRDLRTARALPQHPVVARQLTGYPAPGPAPDESGPATVTAVDAADGNVDGAVDGNLAGAAGSNSDSAAGSNVDGGASDASDGAVSDASDDADGLAMLVERRRMALARETRLNAGQVEVIAEVLGKVPATVPAADLAVAEAELVIAARTLAPRDLRRLGRGVLNTLDTDGRPPADNPADNLDASEAAHSAQTLWFSPGTSAGPAGLGGRVRGLRFGGFLTGENAELFQTLVDAAAKPRKTPEGELDPRTLGQRRADALAIVLRAAASMGGEIPSHGGIKPHLSITVGYADLLNSTTGGATTGRATTGRATSERATTGRATSPPASRLILPSGTDAHGLAIPHSAASFDVEPANGIKRPGNGDLVFGDPLPASDVRRIACDAAIIPIVLGTQSEPLDVGREHRLVTPAIRRALIARDRGCVIPGCGAPPGHCDAHHLIHWINGGETSVDNLALVCTPHHRAIHRGT